MKKEFTEEESRELGNELTKVIRGFCQEHKVHFKGTLNLFVLDDETKRIPKEIEIFDKPMVVKIWSIGSND